MISIFLWKAFKKQHTDNTFFGDIENLDRETGGLSHPVQFCQNDMRNILQMDDTWAFEAVEL